MTAARLVGGCAAAILLAFAAPVSSARTVDCGLPAATPIWIDYGEGSLTPDVRAVFARPGVVVSTSGTVLPTYYRSHGAATTYFVLHLPALVAQAVASSGCTTPWLALNELLGAGSPAPWSPTNAQYRADVLMLMQQLAAGGAHPVLLVHGDPTVAGDTAEWWREVAQTGGVAYEAYYDAPHTYGLGPLLGNRR